MTAYHYTDESNTVVQVIDADGVSRKSMLASEVPPGEVILPADHPSLQTLKESACAAIDAAAVSVDAKYLTCGGQQGQVYSQKLDHANAYKAAGYPALADPLLPTDPNYALYGYVRAYRTTLRVTTPTATDQDAADSIIATALQTAIIVGIQREDLRLLGKALVREAADAAAVQAALDDAVNGLGLL